MAVKVVADGVHLSGLFGTEEIAGSADLEVAKGEGVSGSELVEFGEGLESFLPAFGEGFAAGVEEVGVGLAVGSPDAASELVELRKTEVVGVFDDQGVGVGDIESGFDDGRTDKDIDFTLDESDHNGFQFALAHLAVSNGDSGMGDEFFDAVGDVIDALYSVIDVEHLSASGEFAKDCFADDFVGGWSDEGAYGKSARGWIVDEGHLSDVHEGHAECAGDGSGTHAEDIDVDADGFEGFFVFDAELLFFVDDEEAEVVEFKLVAKEGMGADDDFELTRFEAIETVSSFGRGDESVEEADFEIESGESFGEAAVVLFAKDGGGAEEGDLFSGLSDLEGGADSDFSFAESDIAADEPVHGVVGFEVDFDIFDGLELGGSFDVGKGVFHFANGIGIGVVGVSLNGFALGVELN